MQKYKRKFRRIFFRRQLSAFYPNPKFQPLNPNFVILIDNINYEEDE